MLLKVHALGQTYHTFETIQAYCDKPTIHSIEPIKRIRIILTKNNTHYVRRYWRVVNTNRTDQSYIQLIYLATTYT